MFFNIYRAGLHMFQEKAKEENHSFDSLYFWNLYSFLQYFFLKAWSDIQLSDSTPFIMNDSLEKRVEDTRNMKDFYKKGHDNANKNSFDFISKAKKIDYSSYFYPNSFNSITHWS